MRSTSLSAVKAAALAVAALGTVIATATGAGATGTTVPDTTTGDDTTAVTAGPATDAFPVTVTTAFGDVTIDAEPQRVVALGWGDAEIALALGVQPVGASDWLGFGGDGVGPWAEGLYDESPELIGTMEPSFEAVAALRPDLILDIRSSGDPDRYERLSSIATTVGIPEGGEGWLATTAQQTELIAAALGRSDAGAALLASVDTAFVDAAARHPEWAGKTITVATLTSEGWGAYVEGDGRVDFLLNLGFVQNPAIAALPTGSNAFAVDISSEQLALFDADLIVAFPIFIDTAEITDDPLWRGIPAVAEGRFVVVDGVLSNAYSLATPTSQIFALEQLEALISEALGD